MYNGENLPGLVKRTVIVTWCVATHISLQSHPLFLPSAALESGNFWNADGVSRHSEPITKLLWVSVYLTGPSSFLINYDLRGFDVPRIKRHEGAQAILRNINYLMDIIHRKLRLTVKYNFKVESIMVILTLNPILSGPLSRKGYNSSRRKRNF